jgi:hypothetical protein
MVMREIVVEEKFTFVIWPVGRLRMSCRSDVHPDPVEDIPLKTFRNST